MNVIGYCLRNINGWNVQSRLSININIPPCVEILGLGYVSVFDDIVRSFLSVKSITWNRSSPQKRDFE